MDQANHQNTPSPEQLMGQAVVFSLLGKALYSMPDRAWLQTLIDEQIFTEIPYSTQQPKTSTGLELLQQWTDTFQDGITDEQYQTLKRDYTRLFIGMDTLLAPPWESVYLNRYHLIFQEETLQVREWYRRFGLVSENLNKEPEDHIALEMQFIAYLSGAALQAQEQNDSENFAAFSTALQDFLSQHLLRWGLDWSEKVETQAETLLYKGLGFLAGGALLEAKHIMQA